MFRILAMKSLNSVENGPIVSTAPAMRRALNADHHLKPAYGVNVRDQELYSHSDLQLA